MKTSHLFRLNRKFQINSLLMFACGSSFVKPNLTSLSWKISNNLMLIVILSLLVSGCWASKSVMTSANVTQPVLVGKVITIGGEQIDNSSLMKGANFSAKLENSIYSYTTLYVYGSSTKTEGSNLIDKQLLPYTDGTSTDPTGILIADAIEFNTVGGYWLFALYSANKGSINGSKYYINQTTSKK